MAVFKKKENLLEFPTTPSLVGEDIYLRPARPEDFLEIHRWFLASDPQAQTCHQVKIVSPEERVERMKKGQGSEDITHFVIVLKEDHRTVGHASYFHLNSLNRSVELGVLIAPEERKNGFATDALTTLIRYLFVEMDMNKVYAQTGSFNDASRKLLEGLEFHLDGTLRQHHRYKEELYDDLLYSLLRFECDFLKR